VIETEADLNTLASEASAIKPMWLYTLLSAALNPKIQDSNRKFIGNWIMRSCFLPDISNDFADFFRTNFLPWAMQGSLYTSTLRKVDGELHCQHGERLAKYIEQLLTQTSTSALGGQSLLRHRSCLRGDENCYIEHRAA
jgi:tRNA guanosine-2'-O-methyltransferase